MLIDIHESIRLNGLCIENIYVGFTPFEKRKLEKVLLEEKVQYL